MVLLLSTGYPLKDLLCYSYSLAPGKIINEKIRIYYSECKNYSSNFVVGYIIIDMKRFLGFIIFSKQGIEPSGEA